MEELPWSVKRRTAVGVFVFYPCPTGASPVYALLPTAYLFAICSTDLWYCVFEFLKQK